MLINDQSHGPRSSAIVLKQSSLPGCTDNSPTLAETCGTALGNMGEPGAAMAAAQDIYRNVLKQQVHNKLGDFVSALNAAKDAGDLASIFMLSKAALVCGTDQLVRLMGEKQREYNPAEHRVLIVEAHGYLGLAAACALAGAKRGSALCAAYYIDVIGLVGPMDSEKAAASLAELSKAMMLPRQWSDPRVDLPDLSSGAAGDKPGPCLLEEMVAVRGLCLLSQSVLADRSKVEDGLSCGSSPKLRGCFERGVSAATQHHFHGVCLSLLVCVPGAEQGGAAFRSGAALHGGAQGAASDLPSSCCKRLTRQASATRCHTASLAGCSLSSSTQASGRPGRRSGAGRRSRCATVLLQPP